MLRQVSSRNQRSKGGFKLKNGIQMCLLVVICLWLLYQMKHSHDKKQAYEERESMVSSLVEEDRVEIARFGRKALPHTREAKPEEEEKEDAKTVEQEVRHGEKEEEELRIKMMASQVQESFEKGNSHKEDTASEENINGQVEGSALEHEEASHEAREKSFRGDDVSSEVVHDPKDAEHDERSHEAQERRFKGDDASSAVEHFTEAKESESSEESSFKDDEVSRFVEHFSLENESEPESETEAKHNSDDKLDEYMERGDGETENMSDASSKVDSSLAELLDKSDEGSNSSFGNKEDESPADRILSSNATTSEKKEAEFVPRTPDEVRRSVESKVEKNPEGKTEVFGDIEQLMHSTNSIDNQTELATNSTYRSEDHINLQMNSSALPQNQIETQKMVVDLATNIAYPQGQLAVLHTSQETPGENYNLENSLSEKANVPEETGTTANLGSMEETFKSPSETNENGRTVPLEISPTSFSVGDKQEQRDAQQFNLQNIQNKVDNDKLEAVE